METLADMRGVGVKNKKKYADVLCGRPLTYDPKSSTNHLFKTFRSIRN